MYRSFRAYLRGFLYIMLHREQPPKGLYPIAVYPKRSAPNISAFILRCAIRKAPP